MKLIIAIVSNDDSALVMKELIKERFFVTKLASTGGFLKTGNTTLMIGTKEEDVQKCIDIISSFSKTRKELIPNSIVSEFGLVSAMPIEVNVGGATLFIVDVEQFIKV